MNHLQFNIKSLKIEQILILADLIFWKRKEKKKMIRLEIH